MVQFLPFTLPCLKILFDLIINVCTLGSSGKLSHKVSPNYQTN